MSFSAPFASVVTMLIGTLLAAPAAFAQPGPEGGDDAPLNVLFDDYLEELFEDQPMAATRLGDHRFDDRLDDLSAEARAGWLDRDRRFRAALDDLDADRLSRDGRVDFEILRQYLDREIWLAEEFDPFVDDPRTYVGYTTESVYLLLTQSSLPIETNLANAVARMAQIPRVVEVAKGTIGNPPKVHTETAIAQTKGAIGFYEEDLFLLSGQQPGVGVMGERAASCVSALEAYLAFLEGEVLPRASGEWRIGPDRFDRKLELELNAGMSAEEVIAEAEAEADRVEQEMYYVAKQLWAGVFPGLAVPPDDEEGRRSAIARVLDETSRRHGTAESIVPDVRATVADIKGFIASRDILTLPEPDRCRIEAMPVFMRGNSMAYLNPAPPLDPNSSSEYALSPPPPSWEAARVESFLREYNPAMLRILTIHEAYPGHYVQLEYSNRTPSLIRRILQSGVFAEGWAVYTEQMMLDQGYGDGDLVLRLNQLKFYLRAVLNAILDYRMHCRDMTDAEAMDLLVGRGFQTEGEAVPKVVRSKQSSVQLSTYFVGRLAFHRLRQSVQRDLEDRFDLGRYHEAVLSQGTIPVTLLPELVRRDLGLPDRTGD